MKKRNLFFSAMLLIAVFSLALNSCSKKESGPSELSLVSLKVGTIDLNGAVAPSNVPVNPTITATFNTSVDQATATNTNITLVRDYDKANVPLTISVSGAVVTITATGGSLGNGALFKLSVTTAVKSTGGLLLPQALDRTFTTIGTFVPTGQVAHWGFEGNAIDSVGGHNATATIAITYAASRKAAAGQAAVFNGTTSIMEIPNGDQLETPDFTLAFWVKADTTDHPQGHFVIGLGAFYGFQFEISGDYSSCKLAAAYSYTGGGDTVVFTDNWFPGDGITENRTGWTFCKDLSASGGVAGLLKVKWAHVVCKYNSSSKLGTMYIDGEKMKEQDFNLWPTTDKFYRCTGMMYGGKEPDVVNELAFGFIQSRAGTMWATETWGGYTFPGANHFKGMLDDVRIFNRALTEQEIQLMYNSEKP